MVLFSALLLIALATVGGLALTLLQRSLISQVDSQLSAAAESLVVASLDDTQQTDTSLFPTEYAVTIADLNGLVIRQNSGQVNAASPKAGPVVGNLDLRSVQQRAFTPFTSPAISGSGQWRVLVAPITGGPGGGFIGTASVALPLNATNATMRMMIGALLTVGTLVLAVTGVATYAVVRGSLQPLRRIEATAAQIAAGDLSSRVDPAPLSTEVGSLADSLNTMLGQVEEAFEVKAESEARMQRFVGDASHELRTPLAAVRGYAELYRLGGIPEPEVAQVMERIEGSATRMAALVADLLSLARLDQGASLTLGPVEIEAVLREGASDLRALDPTRPVDLQVESGLSAHADAAALRQVVTNLVGNAAAYTPAGSPVELIARRAGAQEIAATGSQSLATGSESQDEVGRAENVSDGVVIEVRDHGPGVPEADRTRIFDRFARLDAGRTRDAGGSGLGLSIAAAIAAAHGGSIECLPTPGGGATMRVVLPQPSSDQPTNS